VGLAASLKNHWMFAKLNKTPGLLRACACARPETSRLRIQRRFFLLQQLPLRHTGVMFTTTPE